jgi:hypothetical protein
MSEASKPRSTCTFPEARLGAEEQRPERLLFHFIFPMSPLTDLHEHQTNGLPRINLVNPTAMSSKKTQNQPIGLGG